MPCETLPWSVAFVAAQDKAPRGKSILERTAGPFTSNPVAGLHALHGGEALDDIYSTDAVNTAETVRHTPGSIASVRVDSGGSAANAMSPYLPSVASPSLSMGSNYVEQVGSCCN